MNPLLALRESGQSVWLDHMSRGLITGGTLQRLIDEDGLAGMTSNPTIFDKAIEGSGDYDAGLRRAVESHRSASNRALVERLIVEDIQAAADLFGPLYRDSDGLNGFVSLEVSPGSAHATEATIAEARHLWQAVARPNVMIKVPATHAGISAVEALTADGINVNITLMFSLDHYEAVAQAFLRGLERHPNPRQIASVASVFVSRLDAVADPLLDRIGSSEALALRGTIAIANARRIYRRFREIFHGDRFARLIQRGARVQRPLWASTGTKNPAYSDVLYLESLVGPDTVTTVPPQTMDAFRDHGRVQVTLGKEDTDAEATATLNKAAALGVDVRAITEQLQIDGIAAFASSFEQLIATVGIKRRELLAPAS
ncbi:MAG TPA: transaldolase [Vicinamibacterales bacterium]|nr:transaldolase [Vicinamibacterales bacterium]